MSSPSRRKPPRARSSSARTECRGRSRSSLPAPMQWWWTRRARFVKSAQEKAAKLQRQGYFVIILGETDHPEVLALRSYAGEDSLVVEIAGRSARRSCPAAGRRGGADHPVAGASRRAGGASGAPDTRAAGVQHHLQRHRAAADGRHGDGRQVDAVVVVGGRNSGNTRRLAELCAARQPRTYHVESADELEPAVVPRAEGGGHHRRRLDAPRADQSCRPTDWQDSNA